MDAKSLAQTSKKASWLLRHGAHEAGVTMDPAGWVPQDQVLAFLGISHADLQQVVQHNSKSRLQWEHGRIRACQGHSTDGTPVQPDALEASWTRYAGAGPLWHGTGLDALPNIAAVGIVPMARTHVHLAGAQDAKVGKRAGVAVLLEVSVAALAQQSVGVFESPNGVVLVRHVPPQAIVGVVPCTREARAQANALQGMFAASST